MDPFTLQSDDSVIVLRSINYIYPNRYSIKSSIYLVCRCIATPDSGVHFVCTSRTVFQFHSLDWKHINIVELKKKWIGKKEKVPLRLNKNIGLLVKLGGKTSKKQYSSSTSSLTLPQHWRQLCEYVKHIESAGTYIRYTS
jgi:hypothetical protein